MFAKAYSPEQSATGQLENGRDVIILYIKEFAPEVKAVHAAGLSTYSYDWFATEQKDAYVLQITWPNDIYIAVRFNQQHFKLLAALVQPKDVIITTTPISELLSSAQTSGCDFLEFKEVLTFSNMVFSDPSSATYVN